VAQKAGLNREILASSWGAFISMIAYKAEDAGRELIVVNPKGTSQRCSSCGHTEAANRPSQAEFRCQACGFSLHADLNAACNILWLGSSLRRQSAKRRPARHDRAGYFLAGPKAPEMRGG
jgi:putative transposase